MKIKVRRLTLSVMALCSVVLFISSNSFADSWMQYGNDRTNSRHQKNESKLSTSTVGDLQVKWVITTGGDVSSTPTVEGNNVYFGDWAGNLFKVNAKTGGIKWQVSLGDYSGLPGDWTRHSLTITDEYVITGNQLGRFGQGGAKLVAIKKNSAELAWVTQLDMNPSSIVTTSPTVQGGVAYVGIASYEEAVAAFVPSSIFPCCFFRGSVVAVKIDTGEILWQTYMTPEEYSGNAVWGSSPAIDLKRQQLYIATGNNYSAPVSYHDCIVAAGDASAAEACNPEDNYVDSIVALDLKSGAVNWGKRVMPYDTWNVSCSPFLVDGIPGANPPGSESNCAYGTYDAGPDFDFGQAPILYKTAYGDLVGAGQKSGVYWALDAETGNVVWTSRTGPGGLAGGHQWGSASDGERIYTSNANSFGLAPPPLGPGDYTLVDGTETQAGIFSALDGATGEIIWQTANPSGFPAGAPASVANGVMYACSGDPAGYMYALDAATGAVLWSFASGGTCGGGASIVRGTVYWGSGYSSLGGPGNDKLYAFGL
jgi:polyvinyl alcohol dehydrogenase (cytochrome)